MKTVSGSLLATDVLRDLPIDQERSTALMTLVGRALRTIGPATAPRAMFDVLARPLGGLVGWDALPLATGELVACRTSRDGLLITAPWHADLRRVREQTRALATGVRWWMGLNGQTLRVVDAARAYARRRLDVDLTRIAEDPDAAGALVALLGASDTGALETLARAVSESDAHRVAVSRTLERGVEQALLALVEGFRRAPSRRGGDDDRPMHDSLTVIYRILFLLFAEARGLVPHWHPTYRRSYTIESLRTVVEAAGAATGVWESIQAISRLAHRGCRAGTLRVVPFNGRLFAPSAAPLADTVRVRDGIARDALLALTTREGRDRRERITYADLGVEQLGAVYERVLDLAPAAREGRLMLLKTGLRKATGTFYTPRPMTEFLVRRTLAPLVARATSEQVLGLRVLDPAMGSGAFLVAACRYLADAYERALLREGAVIASDLSAADRAAFRRVVAQRCLYGVDRNPMAVQVARLSLWLCTLAADKPLTFLDHHLRAGNSLVGARTADVARQPPGDSRRSSVRPLPLFEESELRPGFEQTIRTRRELADVPDDSAAVVRRKERVEAVLESGDAPLGTFRRVADAWCAAWFTRERIPRRLWGPLCDAMSGRPSTLPDALATRWRSTLEDLAAAERFFHWEFEFPEVFVDDTGMPLADAGFDAVIGNPPWDMVRGEHAMRLTAFARQSGCYAWQGNGHVNLYQLFAERMLRLTRRGGRYGWLMPSGLIADHGSARLRGALFQHTAIDALLSFENRNGIFPIHRGMKFVLVTGTHEGRTTELPARFALRSPAVLDDVGEEGEPAESVRLPLALVQQFSGDSLAVPEATHPRDRAILAAVLDTVPPLGSVEGWGVAFGRELNATDDKPHFGGAGLPVLEGKLLGPYAVRTADAIARIEEAAAARALGGRPFAEPRLGYREVAAASNRLTLIAAVIPAGAVTTHTIFCLKTRVPPTLHWFLCAVFNSYVANYLVRLRGGTHVPAAVVHRLPVPVVPQDDDRFVRLVSLAKSLSRRTAAPEAEREVQSRVAALYGLGPADFDHILSTFPLVDADVRMRAASAFRAHVDAV